MSIPALLIIITNLFFLNISRHFGTRTIALAGLMQYVAASAGCFLADGHLGSANKRGIPFQPRQLVKFHPSVNGMLLLMMIFFIYPANFTITAHEQMGLGLHTTTLIMVGLDLVAFFVGLVFGQLTEMFRTPIKYFAPMFFLVGYLCFDMAHSILPLLVGAVFTGFANGVGVPYLNTIASIKGGRNSATTVMPLLSASLYLGLFLSPVIVTPLARIVFGDSDVAGAYKIGIVFCAIFLVQVYTTRHYQSLPPKE